MRSRYAVMAIVGLLALGASLAGISKLLPEPKAVAAKAKQVRPAYCADPDPSLEGIERAGAVAAIFIETTVFSDGERVAPECSYDLVTAALKGGDSRAEWKSGNIAVVPFVVDHLEPGYVNSYALDGSIEPSDYRGLRDQPCVPDGITDEVTECFPTRVSAQIAIEGVLDRKWVGGVFLIRLVRVRGEWKVSYWQPLVDASSTPGPPQSD